MPSSSNIREAEELSAGLYPHQIEGIAFLLGRHRAILADDMGLGKTRQSILAMHHVSGVGPYLVVCPATVKHNWEREIFIVRPEAETAIVGPPPPPPIGYKGWIIINYDILGKHLDVLMTHPWAGIVFDEAHYLKNHRSQRHRHSRQLVEPLSKELPIHMLTGTPLTNRPRDLFPLLQLANHSLGRSFVSFAKRYCEGVRTEYGWQAMGASNIEELTVQLHGIMLRRTKNKVLDLPPKIRSWIDVEVKSNVARRMSEAVMEALDTRRGEDEDREGAPTSVRRSRQGRILGRLSSARRRLATSKVRSTIPFIEDIVEQGEKVLVFSCFVQPIEIIQKKFGDLAVSISGSTPTGQRQSIADRFQDDDDVRILAANIVAGGIGLNLTAARQVVFNDLDWQPSNHWQAEDRAYRIGQTQSVNVTYMVGRGTVEEFVRTVLEAKSDIIDQLVEGRSLPQDFNRDVMGELHRVMGQVDHRLKEDATRDVEETVGEILREANETYVQVHAETFGTATKQTFPYSEEAIAALASVLAGPKMEHYRIESSSKKGSFYTLIVDTTDVICDCRGFEYRGACQHARALKDALARGNDLPDGFSLVEG